ncbi:hypothetical protein [Actinosynnema mirum]|uniref:Uncharacterized protein n=1 Tax=Actinosynnema mirum (strain ATCC 29888 / DSM 43827 / JCM 3225 / NBRC 14064 / NCIMB 13271 / NRRL B-12336 / IMRU 3971 / 101) TaxID=446462 RepID=C6WH75_ACTMD|nr:hypothetical protein [Actinosynnema mirum]ACU37994.1 hypothetical protein Amir_4139 [Actinosynnema mirum DSM 43827]
MAKFPGSGSSRPDPGSSTPDPGSTTTATPDASPPRTAPPPPPSSAPSGPTGSLGFSMTANSMETLRRQANDLRAAYGDMAGKLSGQRLGATALGMLGMPAVLALNSSNGKSVERAKQAGDTLGQVGDGVKATADTHFSLDRYSGSQFDGIVTDTTARPPAGAPSGGGKPVVPRGPATSQAENVPGDPGAPAPRTPQPQGPPATGVTPVPGDGGTTSAAADTPGAQGPQAQPVPTAPGGRTPGPTTPAAAPGTQLPPIPGFRGDLTAPAAQGAPPAANPKSGLPPLMQIPPKPNTHPAGAPEVELSKPGGAADSLRGNQNSFPPRPQDPPPAAPAPRPRVPRTTPGRLIGPQPGAASPVVSLPGKDPFAPPGATTAPPAAQGQGRFTTPGSAKDSLTAQHDPSAPPAPKPTTPPRPPLNLLPPADQVDPAKVPLPPDPPKDTVPWGNVEPLLDPDADHRTTNAFPVTTINGVEHFDLRNLSKEEGARWVADLRRILDSKPDGAFFWSGNFIDSTGQRHSVMDPAEFIAAQQGRVTLEGKLDHDHIIMPDWGKTNDAGKAVWDSVSASLAQGAKGDVHVLVGPSRRVDNVFSMTEFPILQNNPNVDRVFTIDVMTGEQRQLYP